MKWIALLFIAVPSIFSTDLKFNSLPMQSLEACSNFATSAIKMSSKHLHVICVSTGTGEIIGFEKGQQHEHQDRSP